MIACPSRASIMPMKTKQATYDYVIIGGGVSSLGVIAELVDYRKGKSILASLGTVGSVLLSGSSAEHTHIVAQCTSGAPILLLTAGKGAVPEARATLAEMQLVVAAAHMYLAALPEGGLEVMMLALAQDAEPLSALIRELGAPLTLVAGPTTRTVRPPARHVACRISGSSR